MTAAPPMAARAAGPGATAARWPAPGAGHRARLPLLAAWITFPAGLVLFWLPLHAVKLSGMNGLGLISVLPAASLAGLAVMTVSFAAMLTSRRPVTAVLSVMLVLIVFCLDGVTGLVEPLPRFATAYQISGYVDYVARTGQVAPGLEAYFSWPGFFALIAFMAGAAGVRGLVPLMTWWPVVIDVLVLVPFLLLTKSLRITWQARWLAALLLCLGNWVGQDYFSPQSLNFVLYIAFVAILLTWFSGQPTPIAATGVRSDRLSAASGPVRSLRTPGELPARQAGTPLRAILLLVVVLIFVTSTLSHQLTPFFMLLACAGLVLAGRCLPRGLPVLLAIILAGWISYGTVAYWSGHLPSLFGDLGQLGSTFSASVSGRVSGTAVHRLADESRIAFAALMVVLAAGGMARRWRSGIADRALPALFVAPLAMVGLQNYGGEISLRVYMFALPAIAVLAACLFFPGTGAGSPLARPGRPGAAGLGLGGLMVNHGRSRQPVPARHVVGRPGRSGPGVGGARPVVAPPAPASAHGASLVQTRAVVARPSGPLAVVPAQIAVAALVAVLALLFLVARYGNEAFEQTPRSEYAAMNYIYDHSGPGTTVLWVSQPAGVAATPQMPWEFRDLRQVGFSSRIAPVNPASLSRVVASLRSLGRGAFLITTQTEAAFIHQTAGYPANWEARFRDALSADPALRLVYSGRDAAVYQARSQARRPAPPAPRPAPQARSTYWSPIGLGALSAALMLLGSREFVRECLPDRRWLLRPLAIASLPVLALLAYAVAERFVVLS